MATPNPAKNAQQPEYPMMTSAKRMIMAFAVFVVLVGAGVYLLAIKESQPSENTKLLRQEQATSSPDKHFFYTAIGQAPSDASAPAGSSRAEPRSHNTYTLELKVTDSREAAEALIDSLQQRGISAYYTPLMRNGRVVFRVRRGIYSNSPAAQKAAVALHKDKRITARVIQLQ